MENLNKDRFESFVKEHSTVIVDFWATWCGPCRMLAPILEELAETTDVVIGKVNVDEEEELSVQYEVAAIPTLLLFKDGELKDTHVGYMALEDMKEWISNNA